MIKRLLFICSAILVLMVVTFALSESPAVVEPPKVDPLKLGLEEESKVNLVLLDVLVVDHDGRTVPGLTIEDFEIVVGRRTVPVATLDVDCSKALEDPRGIRHAGRRAQLEPTKRGRRIVLALDYLHLPRAKRAEVLDRAMEMVHGDGAQGDEIMIVALNGGLRVEQSFTGDMEQVRKTLHRMQHDITLWQPSFWHLNEYGWVRGMTTLLDILDTVPGPKAVVLFSAMADVPLDSQFMEIAAQAASSRCSFYPVDVAGLKTIEAFEQWEDAQPDGEIKRLDDEFDMADGYAMASGPAVPMSRPSGTPYSGGG